MRKLILSFLLLTATLTVNAQSNERALAAAIDTIVRTYTENDIVDRFVGEIFEKYKSAYLATRIARSYYNYNEDEETKMRNFHRKDTIQSFKYIRKAIEIDPKYAQAYVLASDIIDYEKRSEGREEAMAWINRGIAQNPRDSALYLASAAMLAFTDEAAAVAKMEELRQQNPGFPVDLELGRMYYKIFDRGGSQEERTVSCEKAVNYYGKADLNDMTKADMGSYALCISYALQDHPELTDKWYELTTLGVRKFPEDIAMRKFLLYACRSCQKWEEGIAAANNYFSMVGGAKMSPQVIDFVHYCVCLRNVKRYDDALAQYEKAKSLEDCSDYWKKQVESQINNTIVEMATNHTKIGEYDKAFAIYDKFIAERKAAGQLDAYLMGMYARTFMDLAEEQNGAEKNATLQKACDVYDQMAEFFPDRQIFALNSKFLIMTGMDPDSEQGLAKPYAEKLISLILSQEDWSADLSKLHTAYSYLAYYYFIKSKYKDAISYCDKVLELNPGDTRAEKIKEIAKKYARR